METPVRQANPFSEDTPLSRPDEMSFGSLAATYRTIEDQFFVALRRGRDQLPNYLVHGAPGSGKTSLLRALRHRLGHPSSPWNLPDALPLPIHVDLAATLSRCETGEGAPMEFIPERFYAQIEQQLLPTIRTGTIMHPAGVEALRQLWRRILDEDQRRERLDLERADRSARSEAETNRGEQSRARGLQRLFESMAIDGLPCESDSAENGPAGLASHLAERYAADRYLTSALKRAVLEDAELRHQPGEDPFASILDGETAASVLHGLHLRHREAPASDTERETDRLWPDDDVYRRSLERVFGLIWIPGDSIRFVPVVLVDGLDAFIQFDEHDPAESRPTSRVRNPWDVVGVLLWLRTLHESSGAGAVLTSRMSQISLSVALGPGASSITDLALQLRIEPSVHDIPDIVRGVLNDWHGASSACSDVFVTADTIDWITRESGGVPGIAKRLCGAYWDELQLGGCDVSASPTIKTAARQRALDAAYDAMRPRFLSMIASAANGGYGHPMELLAQARRDGSLSSDTPGVRALSVMGLVAYSADVDGPSGGYIISMPGLLERFYADARVAQTLPSATSVTLSRSERKLLDVLESNTGEPVSYVDIANHLVGEGVWASGVLAPDAASKLANRVAVLAGRLRKRLEGSGIEIVPARGVGYVLRARDE